MASHNMDSRFAQLIEVNVRGRVFAVCHSRNVLDPAIIGYYTEILHQAVLDNLHEDSNPLEFNRTLDEQAAWLETEIEQNSPNREHADAPGSQIQDVDDTILPENSEPKPDKPKEDQSTKIPSGYVPKAKSMPERLADQRDGLQQLLEEDCVILKLITPDQAKQMKRRLLGQAPEQAEQELVAELRNSLHHQVREFIRNNEGGPWASAKLQDELRMDIVATHTLRSLVTLAKELLIERQDWLKKNKPTLTGRLFGGKINFNK